MLNLTYSARSKHGVAREQHQQSMALWGKKSTEDKPDSRLKQQLRQVVQQSARLEIHRLDEDDIVDDSFGKCRAQDYLEDRHQLVVDHPTHDGEPLEIAVGNRVRAYLELNDAMLYFDALVVERPMYKFASGPSFRALVLKVETPLESGNRRRHFRVEPLEKSKPEVQWRPVSADAALQDTLPWLDARMRDISGRGISLWMPSKIYRQLRHGIRLELSIRLPGVTDAFRLRACIRHLFEAGRNSDWNVVGLEFDVNNDDPTTCIDAFAVFVAECQREIARKLRQR